MLFIVSAAVLFYSYSNTGVSSHFSDFAVLSSAINLFLPKSVTIYVAGAASLNALVGCVAGGGSGLTLLIAVLVGVNLHTALTKDDLNYAIKTLEKNSYKLKGV